MGGRVLPVIWVVLSVIQLIPAQPPFRVSRPPSWAAANEIHGNGGNVRNLPGVLIAGHIPPGTRLTSHSAAGPRLVRPSPPTPSTWPRHGPQIQRAKENSHFEYEVFPHRMNHAKGPSPFRPAASHPRPVYSNAPPNMPAELLKFLAEDGVNSGNMRPPQFQLQSRTDRPQILLQPGAGPTNGEFQEGYRILSDLFMDDSGRDIRNNLVGGSDISFNGAYYPIANLDAAALQLQQQSQPQQAPPPQAQQNSNNNTKPVADDVKESDGDVQITQAEEQALVGENSEQQAQIEPTPSPAPAQMEESESSYGPPHFRPGPPISHHSSFMFTDPNEGSGGYNFHDGGYQGPPPPFHGRGNSIIQPALTRPPFRQNNEAGAAGKQESQSDVQQSLGGYAGQSIENSLRSGGGPLPIMMMPFGASGEVNSDAPPPSSQEVQYALGVLARYASKQAQQMASRTPQQKQTPDQQIQEQSSPNPSFGLPPQQDQQGSTTVTSTSTSAAASEQVSLRDQLQSPSMPFTTPESTSESISTAAGQTEETSPYPVYGPPNHLVRGGQDDNDASSGGYGGGHSGGFGGGQGDGNGGGGLGGGPGSIIGAKVEALKTIQSAVTGGFKQITGLKAGILNAGLSAIGNLGKAKGDFANSLKIPVLSQKDPGGFGGPSTPAYGPPNPNYHGNPDSTPASIIRGVQDIVGQVTGTIAQTGRAALGIGLSKNQFVKNHFAIKGQAFTETVSKKLSNQNQYFQNVLKHVQSIFDAATARPGTGAKNPW